MRLVVAAVLGCILVGLAQEVPPGFDAASFARLGAGTRALGMGGAFVAVAEGPGAGYWNPAGYARLTDFQVEGMYTNWLGADIHYQYLSVGGQIPWGEDRLVLHLGDRPLTFGLSWLSVQVTDIPWWEEDGTFGTFDAWSHLVFLSVAWPVSLDGAMLAGVNVKVYHDRILEGVSFGVGADVGFLWKTEIKGIPVQLGVCTTDLGSTRIQWYGTTGEPVNYVPWLIRLGVAVELWDGMVLLSASFERGVDRPRFERVRAGAEIRLEWLSLRAGWNQLLTGEPGQWSVGLGVNPMPWLALDYAFLPGPLKESHLISLRVAF